jgi:tellurite resistance protein TehA-like permease
VAAIMTAAHVRRRTLPFSLAWWAFTFPLGAFAAAGNKLGTLLHLETVWLVGLASFILLGFLWIATLIKTVQGIFRGTLLTPSHPVPATAAR